MIEFTPTSKIGRIDIHGTECFTDAYITEIQRRLALLKYAKSFVEKMLMDRNITSRDLMPSTQTVAAVLSPTVEPGLKVIPLPVHMQFVDMDGEFYTDVLLDGNPSRNPKITVTLYKKANGDTYIYVPDTDSWTLLEPDKRHPLIKLMEVSSGVQFAEEEAEGILEINRKLIQLHDTPRLRGFLKYGLFFITREKDGAIIRDGRACLISGNPSCVGMGIVLDGKDRLTLCQRYVREELLRFFPEDLAIDMKHMPNEWVPVYSTEDPEELIEPTIRMLDHFIPDGPSAVLPISRDKFARISRPGMGPCSIATSENPETYTEQELDHLSRIVRIFKPVHAGCLIN